MEAKVIWQGGMKFDGTADTGFHVPISADVAVGGEGQGFKPMELIAVGLAGCTALDVISILQKKRQGVTEFEVQVHARRFPEYPKVFTQAVIEYFVTGRGVDEAALVRSIELSATRYCPAQAMFKQVFPIELRYHIFEVGENDERQLVKSGTYMPPLNLTGLAPEKAP
jgi:putative redox protein